jgi:hypothetical protein
MTIEERLVCLESRLRVAEDRLAILDLLNTYGPLVDSGSSHEAAGLWIDGGGYSFSGGANGGARVLAPDDLVDIYEGEGHQHLVRTGSSHLTATPRIKLDGDRAEAVAYSYVVLKEDGRWFEWRAAINHWTLVREETGWRIRERINRVLDGSPGSHDLMRKVLD